MEIRDTNVVGGDGPDDVLAVTCSRRRSGRRARRGARRRRRPYIAVVAFVVLAHVVALGHLSLIAFLVIGGPASVRWPRLLPAHVTALAGTIAVNLAHLDCPLTALEKQLDRWGGRTPYAHGFNSHYLVEPFHSAGITAQVNLVLLTVLLVPTTVAYAAVTVRSRHR